MTRFVGEHEFDRNTPRLEETATRPIWTTIRSAL